VPQNVPASIPQPPFLFEVSPLLQRAWDEASQPALAPWGFRELVPAGMDTQGTARII